ncbi:sulfite exporter TauE/SafE family protein [Stackebrandtia soli]|uniref:sulfite exporter TauE/SafE family protein n=1 Tax=Stackebrandtia soli TaxID=1892856 RepID=UPI0039EBC946
MTIDPITFTLVLALAALSGALGSAVGMAGGVFLVPVLTIVGGVPWETAVAVSLFSVVASSSAAAPAALAAGLPNLRLAVTLEVATVLGSLGGIALLGLVHERILYGVFAAVLIVSAVQVLKRRHARTETASRGRDWGARLRLNSTFRDDGDVRSYVVRRVPTGLTVMFGAGTLSALLGIGSGVLKIPAMDMTLGLPIKVSSATANLMIGVTGCGTALAFLLRGTVTPLLAASAVLGSVVGSMFGARLLVRVPASILRTAMVVVLAVLAVPMTAFAFVAA